MKRTLNLEEPVRARRLTPGEPLIGRAHFAAAGVPEDGSNINGPSVIRVPDWIPPDQRAHPDARHYCYFAHHAGHYIRLAWARDIAGPWTLFNVGTQDDARVPGRGVLDLALHPDRRIKLPGIDHGGGAAWLGGHIASPDVNVDDVNRRIVMYFHGPGSRRSQDSFVATSGTGLNFNPPDHGGEPGHGVRSVILGGFYFKTFVVAGRTFAYANKARLYRAPALTAGGQAASIANGDAPGGLWNPPQTPKPHDPYWEELSDAANPIRKLYAQLGLGAEDPRHFAVYHNPARDPDRIFLLHSARNDAPERIWATVLTLEGLTPAQRQDPANWTLAGARTELLRPEEPWEGTDRPLIPSKDGAQTNVQQLRDPDLFEDSDGGLVLFYCGKGEEAIGAARLNNSPTG